MNNELENSSHGLTCLEELRKTMKKLQPGEVMSSLRFKMVLNIS
jgi:hypothetical protein